MGVIHASHAVEIEASVERCFEVASDIPGAITWQPSLETVKVLETDSKGRAVLVDSEADAMVKKAKTRLRFDYSKGPTGMEWDQEKGDVKSLHGSWEFTELDAGRTRATYALEIDPGRMLGMLLRGPVEGKVKEFLTKGAAEGLKEHLEAG